MTDIKEFKEEKKIGRPKEWTEERIEKFSYKLLEWADKTNSYALIQFCADENIQPNKLGKLAKENEDFRSALMLAKSKLASRMIQCLTKEGACHPVFFNKYIRANDWLLDQSLKEQENADSQEIAKHVVKIINFADIKKERDGE